MTSVTIHRVLWEADDVVVQSALPADDIQVCWVFLFFSG